MSGELNLGIEEFAAQTTLTIATGVVTITQGFHVIAAESGTTDDLDTISLGSALDSARRQMIYLIADTGDTITVKHGTGNIVLNGAADFSLTASKMLALFYDGTNWHDLA
jgi:hypothetical protein